MPNPVQHKRRALSPGGSERSPPDGPLAHDEHGPRHLPADVPQRLQEPFLLLCRIERRHSKEHVVTRATEASYDGWLEGAAPLTEDSVLDLQYGLGRRPAPSRLLAFSAMGPRARMETDDEQVTQHRSRSRDGDPPGSSTTDAEAAGAVSTLGAEPLSPTFHLFRDSLESGTETRATGAGHRLRAAAGHDAPRQRLSRGAHLARPPPQAGLGNGRGGHPRPGRHGARSGATPTSRHAKARTSSAASRRPQAHSGRRARSRCSAASTSRARRFITSAPATSRSTGRSPACSRVA